MNWIRRGAPVLRRRLSLGKRFRLRAARIELPTVEITLEENLRRDLVDVAARLARRFPRLTQRALGGNGRESLVPGTDLTAHSAPQFFRKAHRLLGRFAS